ncbi:MAG: hypothetical protein KAU58_00645, partial [Candidatus Omnitrophica bacterium]|nr:hypothetical protein [Candidatus Omnitrophota bacterium]
MIKKMHLKSKLKINRDCPRKGTVPVYLLLLLISFFARISTAYPLPEVETIEKGTIEIHYPDSTTMQIKATDNTIINYTSFNIDTNESLIVNLPSSESRILNRVTGNERSSL